MRLDQSGNLGIGTTTPFEVLTTQGNAFIGGNLTATGTINVQSTSATSTFSGGLSVSGGLALSSILSCTEALETDGSGNIVCGTDATGGASFGQTWELLSNTNFLAPTTTSLGIVIGTTTVPTTPTQLTVTASSTDTTNLLSLLDETATEVLTVTRTGLLGVGTTSPAANLAIHHDEGETAFFVGSSTASFLIDASGNVGIGTTTGTALLTLDRSDFSSTSPITAGIDEYFRFALSAGTQFGNSLYIDNAPTATNTLVGQIIRIADDTSFGNTVRGLEVQAHRQLRDSESCVGARDHPVQQWRFVQEQDV